MRSNLTKLRGEGMAMPFTREDQLGPGLEMANALDSSTKRLALALSVSQMGMWEIDLATGAVVWSPECYELTRFDHFEGTMEAFEAAVHPDDRAGVLAAIARAVEDHETFAAEFRFRRGDGAWRWFANRGRAEYDPDGTPTRMYGTVQDLTESRIAQDGLRDSEERFRQLAESIQEVFWLSDVAKSEIVYVSPGYETVWGRECDSLYADPHRKRYTSMTGHVSKLLSTSGGLQTTTSSTELSVQMAPCAGYETAPSRSSMAAVE